jgi:hypothetical protein
MVPSASIFVILCMKAVLMLLHAFLPAGSGQWVFSFGFHFFSVVVLFTAFLCKIKLYCLSMFYPIHSYAAGMGVLVRIVTVPNL